jgi:hypothetical protein
MDVWGGHKLPVKQCCMVSFEFRGYPRKEELLFVCKECGEHFYFAAKDTQRPRTPQEEGDYLGTGSD